MLLLGIYIIHEEVMKRKRPKRTNYTRINAGGGYMRTVNLSHDR